MGSANSGKVSIQRKAVSNAAKANVNTEIISRLKLHCLNDLSAVLLIGIIE